jgi:hypothetical protein
MEYNPAILKQVKAAISEYMHGRFRIRPTHLRHAVPNFETISQSSQVETATISLGDEKPHYVREALRELVSEKVLIIKRRGDLHCFSGDNINLEAMFSETSPSEESGYTHVPSHLGYGTHHDSLLIYDGLFNTEEYLNDL